MNERHAQVVPDGPLLLSGRVALGVALVAHVLLCLTLVGEYRATQLEQREVVAGVAWLLAMLAAITAVALYGWISRSWWSLLLASVGWIGASIGAFLLARKLGYVDSETEGTGGELFFIPFVLLIVAVVVKRSRRGREVAA
jgi:hypothetical protein